MLKPSPKAPSEVPSVIIIIIVRLFL